jgi:hypothetical protein
LEPSKKQRCAPPRAREVGHSSPAARLTRRPAIAPDLRCPQRKLYSISVFAAHIAHRAEEQAEELGPAAGPREVLASPNCRGSVGVVPAHGEVAADGAASAAHACASAHGIIGIVSAPYAGHAANGGPAPRTPRGAARSPPRDGRRASEQRSPSSCAAHGATRPSTAAAWDPTYAAPSGWGPQRATPAARRPAASPSAQLRSSAAVRELAPLSSRTPPRVAGDGRADGGGEFARVASRTRRLHHASLSTSEFRELNRLRAAKAPRDMSAERRRAPSPPRGGDPGRASKLPSLMLSEEELELVDSWRAQHGVLQGVGPVGHLSAAPAHYHIRHLTASATAGG